MKIRRISLAAQKRVGVAFAIAGAALLALAAGSLDTAPLSTVAVFGGFGAVLGVVGMLIRGRANLKTRAELARMGFSPAQF